MSRDAFLPNPFPPFQPGAAQSPSSLPPTAWERLAKGKTIGKSSNLVFDVSSFGINGQGLPNVSPTDILAVQGPDECAMQFCLTLAVPKQIDQAFNAANTATIQQAQAGYDNIAIVRTGMGGDVGGVLTGNGNNRIWANLVAEIEWGSGGINHRCEADFSNGLCVNLCGSFVRVKGFAEPNPVGFNSAYYQLAATLSPGYAKSENAQRSIMAQTRPAINTETPMYTVPRFAKRVSLTGANDVHDPFVGTLRFYREPNLVNNNRVADLIFAGNNPGPFPVPNGAYYFTFFTGIANPTQTATFELAV